MTWRFISCLFDGVVGGLKRLIEELTDNLKQSEIERGELMELISASNSRGNNSNGDVSDLQTVHVSVIFFD